MEHVKRYTCGDLQKKLLGKRARFKSDCELFPNFDVTGKVTQVRQDGAEIIIHCLTVKRNVIIGSNMKNLRFEVLNS